ncbi:choice-of-anchor D domain-containing protein [Ascidiimonas sp. W6]|uniref:choice-of-anchor D domain-containing protein n=1 Tax=Ascidiimonas meishanensis TaxID=3128903 RepID=UPI0030EE911A
MRNAIFCLLTFLLILACGKNDDNLVKEEIAEGELPVTSINIDIKLPSNTSFSIEDLTLATFADEKDIPQDGNVDIDIYQSEGYEIVFAQDNNEDIVLYGIIAPSGSNKLIINSESTALALIMTHPWAINFAPNTKSEAISYIKGLDIFKDFIVVVENGIRNRTLNSLNVDDIIENIIIKKQESGKRPQLNIKKEPLEADITNGVVNVTNNGNINGYGLRLYDTEGKATDEVYFLEGEKEITSFDRILEVFTNTSSTFKATEINFPIPTDGQWLLKAKNGLPLADESKENSKARWNNLGRFTANTIGLFSYSLKRLFLLSDCLTAVGEYMSGQMIDLLNDFYLNRDDKSLLKNTLKLFSGLTNDVFGIVNSCSGKPIGTSTLFGKIRVVFARLSQVDKIESFVQLAMFFNDLAIYNNQEEFCFVQDNQEVFYCDGLSLLGDTDFGEVGVGTSESRIFTLMNTLESEINILDIVLPDGFSVDWSSGLIPLASSQEILVTFSPFEEKEYTGEIMVKNDAVIDDTLVMLTGIGIYAPKLEIIGEDLDFGQIVVGENSPVKSFIIKNNSDTAIEIKPLSTAHSEVTLDGGNGGIINAGDSIIINAVFSPVQNTSDAIQGIISVETIDGKENLKINYFGSKRQNDLFELLTNANLWLIRPASEIYPDENKLCKRNIIVEDLLLNTITEYNEDDCWISSIKFFEDNTTNQPHEFANQQVYVVTSTFSEFSLTDTLLEFTTSSESYIDRNTSGSVNQRITFINSSQFSGYYDSTNGYFIGTAQYTYKRIFKKEDNSQDVINTERFTGDFYLKIYN